MKMLMQSLNQLSERDRRMLLIGICVVGVYLIDILLYAPLLHAVAFQSQQFVDKKETLLWMQQQATQKIPKRHTDGNLLTVFSEQLKHAPFLQYPYQLQQSGTDRVQLTFASVPYVTFMTWLHTLNKQYAMTVVELSAAPTQTAGVVKLRLVVAAQEKKS